MTPPLTDAELAASLDGGFTSAHADVNGVRLHYVAGGGQGTPLILLGGWPQTWWQFHKIMPALAAEHRVVAVDIRGQGGSAKPADGYDKRTMAADVHALIRHLGYEQADVAGHDIGGMVAEAVAALYPDTVRRLVVLDVPHPDESVLSLPLLPQGDQDAGITGAEQGPGTAYLWWFAFNQVPGLPEALLEGRERVLVDWLCRYMLRDQASIDDDAREVYARALAAPGAVRAGNAWYQAFVQDVADLAEYPPLSAPVLGLACPGNMPLIRGGLAERAADLTVAEVPDSGHYLPEEQPEFVADSMLRFLR
ncbi:alpha/beta fold hydrolase [Nocardiopsis suaedae]|uniref:Alpha/beta hydrolase n=1 Tax=Nocardiopsis suaedae TaxID=3018444 RepID=A0ABT4TT54_9ACTN|nr:alpha/beta hydrolase [Nocardiopsis suaedae]MDA2807873.1 alpha/beta hydrolase [Nocardiopsis suaedae]